MELKPYQQGTLDALAHYLDALREKRGDSVRAVEALKGLPVPPAVVAQAANFPEMAWEILLQQGRVRRTISPRGDGTGRPVPNITLKVPTGGGKTLLAAYGVGEIVSRFVGQNTGLVLWIVPNEAIYTQTRRTLLSRVHPYRQALDRAGAGRVRILDKDTPLARQDVEANLCVMLLMLQSTNRETNETLRVFRERGSVTGFMPPEGDAEGHRRLLEGTSNLDKYAADLSHGAAYPIVKESLGNAIRLCRPIVVLDEGHRGTSALAMKTLYGLNPSFVLELTATPREGKEVHPNVLCDVKGKDLDAAQMIKMPIEVTVDSGADWRECLRIAWEKRDTLEDVARIEQGNSGRYIRPILLVQVQLTGKDKRDAGKVHADDVVEHLKGMGVDPNWIAKKTADTNELQGEDLLSERSTIRAIVTKQALQEGWDCPFAYVLCTLAASSSLGAMTQMVGRVLRQPDATRTNVEVLDRCYVFCNQVETGKVVDTIRKSLESDGMGDLVGKIVAEGDGRGKGAAREVAKRRRPQFAEAEIYLPKVVWTGDGEPRELEWESDIQSGIDWSGLDVTPLVDRLVLGGVESSRNTLVYRMDDLENALATYDLVSAPHESPFDPVYATRLLTQHIPNPFVARMILGRIITGLRTKGFGDKQLAEHSGHFISEILRWAGKEQDRLAEAFYRNSFKKGLIEFRVQKRKLNWAMPRDEAVVVPKGTRPLVRGDDAQPLQKSLFEPEYEEGMNSLEITVAGYLDGRAKVDWWYRNVTKASSYSLKGWRKNRVYPDFIIGVSNGKGGPKRIVLETKGDQLEGNLDTEYKRKLLDALTEGSKKKREQRLETLGIEVREVPVECVLLTESEWASELALRLEEHVQRIE